MAYCTKCGEALREGARFCTKCGNARAGPSPMPPHVAPPSPPELVSTLTAFAASATRVRKHHPAWALASGIVLPGAGQAYNGQPRKAFYLLLGSVLVLPYLYSLYDAYHRACQIVGEGGRRGPGGLLWVGLQGWRALNVVLAVLIGLTLAGVLS